jgi:hypothetical protein
MTMVTINNGRGSGGSGGGGSSLHCNGGGGGGGGGAGGSGGGGGGGGGSGGGDDNCKDEVNDSGGRGDWQRVAGGGLRLAGGGRLGRWQWWQWGWWQELQQSGVKFLQFLMHWEFALRSHHTYCLVLGDYLDMPLRKLCTYNVVHS